MEKSKTKNARRNGPGRLSAADSALIIDRVLDAATELFLADGYAATTMESIARRAGASTKTLYSRYANKSEILAAVAQRILNRTLSAPPNVAAGSENVDPRPFIQQAAREFGLLYMEAEPPRMMRLALSEGYRHPELARFFIENHQRVVFRLAEALERWHRAGQLPRLGHPQITAAMFIEMVASIPRIRAILGQPLSRKEINLYITTAVDIFLRGLGYESGPTCRPSD